LLLGFEDRGYEEEGHEEGKRWRWMLTTLESLLDLQWSQG
jgi:hypothetical protein